VLNQIIPLRFVSSKRWDRIARLELPLGPTITIGETKPTERTKRTEEAKENKREPAALGKA
jgi:hypothetical protein